MRTKAKEGCEGESEGAGRAGQKERLEAEALALEKAAMDFCRPERDS